MLWYFSDGVSGFLSELALDCDPCSRDCRREPPCSAVAQKWGQGQ
jgi:hypothetical protein